MQDGLGEFGPVAVAGFGDGAAGLAGQVVDAEAGLGGGLQQGRYEFGGVDSRLK